MSFLLKLLQFILSLFGIKPKEPPQKPPAPPPGHLSPDLISKISSLAASSPAASINWRDRGRAPPGYLKGMAVAFAAIYLKWRAGDSAALVMSRAVRETPENDETDALSWYNSNFRALGMSNDVAGDITLRHLFVLLTGLGMRESSGRYCEGRDQSASNVSAESAESGLFQTSWDIHGASPEFSRLFGLYSAGAPGYLEVFREGVTPRTSDLEIYGIGDGATFQKLCKDAPTFAVETAAVGLRTRGGNKGHWGPIRRKEVELRIELDELLQSVQKLVDGGASVPIRPPVETPSVVQQWPRESTPGALDAFYGDPRGSGGDVSPEWIAANMVKITPPYRMTYEGQPVSSIFIHKKCAASLSRILKSIWEHYGRDQKKIESLHLHEFDGSFNYRPNRNDPSKLSVHSYGAAIDIAAAENPNGKPWQSGMMPISVVRAFKAEGWAWGGQFNGTKDCQHFQATYNIHANEPLPDEGIV